MKYNKILRTLALTLTLALILAILPTIPALAYDEEINLDPDRGEIGDTITITGSDFNPGSGATLYAAAIYFAEDEAVVGDLIGTSDVDTYERVKVKEIDSWGEFETTFTVPAVLNDGTDDEDVSLGTYYIYVTYDYYDPESGQHNYSSYIETIAVFTVSSGNIILDPDDGVVGTEVEVTGEDFGDDEDIEIEYDGDDITDEIIDGDDETDGNGVFEFTIVIPESTAGAHTITVTGEESLSEAVAEFTVEPQITLSPASGPSGTEVTVTGTGFGRSSDIEYVELDNDEVDIESGDEDTSRYGSFDFTFLVPPEDLDTYDLQVEDEDGNTAEAEFTIVVAAATSLSLTTGYVGTEVTVTGTGFRAGTAITITLCNRQFSTAAQSDGSFSASFNIPTCPAGTHEMTISDGTSTATATFEVKASASLSQNQGHVGTEVTVTGTGFKAASPVAITFANKQEAATITDGYGSFSASFTVPGVLPGTHRVRISDGTNTAEANFEIRTSASLSATTGHVGTNVTVSGVGFEVGKTATITYGGTEVAKATVAGDGTFSATFNVPASASGQHTIVVTDGTNTQQFTFAVESDAPSPPTPLEPEMGVKAKSTAYFDWEEVTDPSGVTYTLQIATDADFSQDSIVLEKTGITQSEYTITKDERLESVRKDTPYHWHVRAVDGASNESLWSGAGQFYVGVQFALGQTLIYVLLGIGILLAGIIGFWLGRKSLAY